tara:strand:+ start:2917 stop:5343 length:2427 start_codon:yes stop_codon:yes gene_type:complete
MIKMSKTSQKYEALNKYTKMRQHLTSPMPVLNTGLIQWAEAIGFGTDLEQIRDDVIREAIAQVNEQFIHNGYGKDNPMFIRACPLHPRPGVLESSPASSLDEAEEIVHRIVSTMLSKETGDSPMHEHGYVDPEGCIITQPFIDADASAVLYPNSHIVMGEGHDGITAGRDCFKMIMKVSTVDSSTNDDLTYLDIDPTKIELEFISRMRKEGARTSMKHMIKDTYLVQLRGSHGAPPIAPAPTMPSTFNGKLYSGNLFGCDDGAIYVKQIIHVKNADDSELAWLEEQLREHAGKEGLVVSHPLGTDGTHHCGQCVKYGVPYIKGEVKEFETYIQVVNGWVCNDPIIVPQPYDIMEHADAFMEGVDVGLYQFARQFGWLSNQFHQFMDGQMLHDPDQTAYLAGVFAGYMVSAPYSVALGECRHYGQKKNKTPQYLTTLSALYANKYHNNDASLLMETLPTDRKAFYATVENVPITLESYIGGLEWMKNIYSTGWSGGYGGTNYANSCAKSLKVAVDIMAMQKDFNTSNMMALCGAVNDCENIVHNNGFFLNKFLLKYSFDIGTDVNQVKMYLDNNGSAKVSNIFNVFYAGREAIKLRKNVIGIDTPKLHDNTDVSTYALKRMKLNKKTLRGNPIFLDDNLPQAYHEIQYQSNFHAGQHGDSHSNTFIPCGHTDCTTCKNHLESKVLSLTVDVAPPTPPKNLDMVLPSQEQSILSAGEITFVKVIGEVNTVNDLFEPTVMMKEIATDMNYNTESMMFAVRFLKGEYAYYGDNELAYMNKHYSQWITNISGEDMVTFINLSTDYDNKLGEWN